MYSRVHGVGIVLVHYVTSVEKISQELINMQGEEFNKLVQNHNFFRKFYCTYVDAFFKLIKRSTALGGRRWWLLYSRAAADDRSDRRD